MSKTTHAKALAPPLSGSPNAGASSSISAEALKLIPLAQLVDEFGPIDEKHRAFKANEKLHEVYRKELERRCADAPADAESIFEGHRYQARVGPKAMEREVVDRPKCYDVFRKLVSLDVLKSLFRPLLSDVDKYVPLGQHHLFLRAERTGRRPVEAAAKVSVAQSSPKAA